MASTPTFSASAFTDWFEDPRLPSRRRQLIVRNFLLGTATASAAFGYTMSRNHLARSDARGLCAAAVLSSQIEAATQPLPETVSPRALATHETDYSFGGFADYAATCTISRAGHVLISTTVTESN